MVPSDSIMIADIAAIHAHAQSILDDLEILGDHIHSVGKVIPTGAAALQLAASGTAWTYGAKGVLMADSGAAPLDFHFMNIEKMELAGTYEIALFSGAVPVLQVETLTVATGVGTGTPGDITIHVDSSDPDIHGDLVIAVVDTENLAAEVATAIKTFLGTADTLATAISTLYTVGGTGANVTFTAKAFAANDAALNFGLTDAGGTGVTFTGGLTSNSTAPGVADYVTLSTIRGVGDASTKHTAIPMITPLIPPNTRVTAAVRGEEAVKAKYVQITAGYHTY